MEISRRERRVEDEEQRESELPNLPQEIIIEILLRLPVKSVGRCRCVSKLFLSLLSTPRFTKTHLDRSLRSGPFRCQNQRLILSSHNLYSAAYESIGENGEAGGHLMAVEIDYPLKDKPNLFSELIKRYARGRFLYCGRTVDDDDEADEEDEYPVMVEFDSVYQRNWVDIVGSCNGLVCISPAESTLFLFNPTTRESKRVPDLPESLLSGSEEEDLEAYGFGFDAVSDDYKVIRLVSGAVVAVSVYSLRTDSWKYIGNSPYAYGDSFYSSGVLLNGAIHWVVSRRDDDDHKRLVAAFDLSNEKFWDMPLPNDADDCSHRFRDFVVGVLDGCLCIVNSCHEMHEDIWVMREYGVAKSWTRLRISVSYRFMKPLCTAKSGEVLLELNGDLVVCNLENQLYRELKIHGVQLNDGFEAESYVESLISPNLYCGD